MPSVPLGFELARCVTYILCRLLDLDLKSSWGPNPVQKCHNDFISVSRQFTMIPLLRTLLSVELRLQISVHKHPKSPRIVLPVRMSGYISWQFKLGGQCWLRETRPPRIETDRTACSSELPAKVMRLLRQWWWFAEWGYWGYLPFLFPQGWPTQVVTYCSEY